MRRLLALIAAVVLVASLASSSLAAGPTDKVNRFVGNFRMLHPQTGEVVARVVVNFKEPTHAKMVPGTLDVYWTPGWGDPANAEFFPFMDLQWYPVRESHAQLIGGFFGPDAGGIVGGVSGFLCDYTVEWNADCRDFSAIFITSDDPALPNRVAWGFKPEGGPDYDYRYWFDVGKGAFSLTYAGPTGS
jgi:hypothetical protein